MATHSIVASTYYRTFSRHYPALARIRPGDTVVTKTLDSGGQDYQGKRLHEPGNPLTGPFFIDGAEPGDSISVRLDKVRLNRDWGYTSQRLGLVALDPASIEKLHSANYKMDLVRPGRADIIPWDIDVKTGRVSPREPRTGSVKMEFQARPMLGCIGVAPAGDFAPTSGPSGAWGGNIDYNRICEGATVHLPVFQPGALLYMGDGHALQGDGEPLGNGIETSMDVEFTVNLRKKTSLTGPRVENLDSIISIGSQAEFSSSLDRGLQMATSDMVKWMQEEYGVEPWAAHVLVGVLGEYHVVTVAGSMALRIPRSVLPARK